MSHLEAVEILNFRAAKILGTRVRRGNCRRLLGDFRMALNPFYAGEDRKSRLVYDTVRWFIKMIF
jgi:hypothetical protein